MFSGFRRLFCVFALFCCTAGTLAARSWADLDEGEHEIYGREREEKLPIRFFFVQKEKWENHDSFHAFWLFAYKDYPRYKSNRLFPFYYQLTSKVDNRYYFLSLPYFQEIDGKSNTQAILWLYYWGKDADEDKNYKALFPLFYSSSRGADSTFLLTPLFWYSSWRAGGDKSPKEISIGFPIIPLVMWDSSPDETDFTLLYLIRHRKRPDRLLSYALPFYFYSRHSESSLVSFLVPLIWIKNSPESSSWLIFPIFYSAEKKGETTRISPFYVALNGEQSQFRMLIPLYLSYSGKDYSLHINATGVSVAEERLTHSPVGFEVNQERIMVDWDLGWFYNLFRFSSRDTLRFKPAEVSAEPGKAAPEKPRLMHKRGRNRADSENFFGLYMLFGGVAYERADHYRHFRLLPLSWLTWDTRSDTGVQTVIPVYVHYRDEDTRYLVVAPLYGIQEKFLKNCTSFISTWLLIGYISEFDCATRQSERSVLWPVVNWYAAPQQQGFRIFPFFWMKWWQESGNAQQGAATSHKSHFSPLHYTRVDGETYQTYSWLFYRTRSEQDHTFGIWALLHLGFATDGARKTIYVLSFFYRHAEPGPGRNETLFTFAAIFWHYRSDNPGSGDRPEGGDYFRMQISPLYLYFGDGHSGTGAGRSYFYSWLWYRTETQRVSQNGFPLIFHRRVHRDNSYANFYLFPFYHSSEIYSTGEKSVKENVNILLPVYYSRTNPAETVRFVGGYFYKRSDKYASDNFMLLAGRTSDRAADTFSWHALLYTLYYEGEPQYSDFRFAYGLGFKYASSPHEFSWHFALITGYNRTGDTYKRHHFLPLWWHSRSGDDTNLYLPFILSAFRNHNQGNNIFRAVMLGLLYYQNSDYAAYDQTLHALMGIIYYHSKYPERKFDSYGSLWGGLWHYETEENYKRFSFLTFIYIRTETEQGVRHRLLGIPL